WVPEGRIRDWNGKKYRTAIREIIEEIQPRMRITPNCNLYFYELEENAKGKVEAILRRNGIPLPEELTRARKVAHACVALPTCGLALAESERVFTGLMEKIDAVLRELGLEKEPILIRMSGCPNGCPRPYNADIGFVGRAPGKYAVYMGGSIHGDRLAGLLEKTVNFEQIVETIRPYLERFAKERKDGESFSEFYRRTWEVGESPSSEQFHVELEERKRRLEEKKLRAEPVGE
ncbi:MAG: hypothetical protein NZL93_07070, partial [Chthoniobacterales bacterium]|nr:hypothetical protein [Chthoniobacterales bacterium]